MLTKALAGILIILFLFPIGIFAQEAPQNPEEDTQLEEETQNEEEALRSRQQKAKLVAGISISATGAVLAVIGGLFADELQKAEDEYNSFDGSGSIDDIKKARERLDEARLAYYLPMVSGLALSGIGLVIALNGTGGVQIYERSTYSPEISETGFSSSLVITPGFTGLRLRH